MQHCNKLTWMAYLQLLAPAAEEPPQPLLQRSTKKEARLRGLHFKGGKFESPRPEEEDMLRAEFTPLASPALRCTLPSEHVGTVSRRRRTLNEQCAMHNVRLLVLWS
jgi:hypothetical protein